MVTGLPALSQVAVPELIALSMHAVLPGTALCKAAARS